MINEMFGPVVTVLFVLFSIILTVITVVRIKRDNNNFIKMYQDGNRFRKLQSLLELRAYDKAAKVVREILPNCVLDPDKPTRLRHGNVLLDLDFRGIVISTPTCGHRRLVDDMSKLESVVKFYTENPNG